MAKIKELAAHQIIDSRGNPTIEVHLALDSGVVVTAAAPSGASIGKHEAVEIRDHNMQSFLGLSVEKAIASVNKVIAPVLVGENPTQQGPIDGKLIALDGTPDKSKLGGNSLIATSTAVCKAGAVAEGLQIFNYVAKLAENDKLTMPTPMFNVINGGLHGTGNLDIQEFMVVPVRRTAYHQALEMGDEIYLTLKEVLGKKSLLTSLGDEGGYTPALFTNASALDLIVEAIRQANLTIGQDVFISLDVAADQLIHGGRYFIKDASEPFGPDGLISFYQNLISRYSILSIEDPFAEDDWGAWRKLRETVGNSVMVVGDDLTVTNPLRVKQAIAEKAISSVIIKPNQIGTISETLEVVKIAKEAGITPIASHRSGETEDTFMADFAVGIGAEYFKGGAPARGERTAKYNRFLEIEGQLAATLA